MDQVRAALGDRAAFEWALARAVSHFLSRLAVLVLGLSLAGCSVMWVSNYDKESVDRTTEISKSIIKFYQELMVTDINSRPAAVSRTLGKSQSDVESLIRLHVLREEARTKNIEGATIARNLLRSWEAFSASHRSKDKTALSDETLISERSILERHSRAGFSAEEAKKPGASSSSAK